jgi:hypothetical protein
MKKLISSVAAAAVLSSAAVAAPNLAADGTGDFLIAPAFFAQGTFETHLKVINTNTTNSIIVRAVVRDSANSREVDFPILLTPGDVWTGKIYATTVNGVEKTFLYSNDDSNYLPHAAEGNGIDLAATNTNAKNGFKSGYVEFYPIAQYNEGKEGKVSKDLVMVPRFKALANNTIGTEIAVDENSLTGTVTVVNNSSAVKAAMTLEMTAIENASDAPVRGAVMAASQDTIPTNFLVNNAAFPGNELDDFYRLFQDDQVVVPFDNKGEVTNVLLTFWGDYSACETRSYTIDIRDNAENMPEAPSPIPTFSLTGELASVGVKSLLDRYQTTYESGWIKINNLTNVNTATCVGGQLSNQAGNTGSLTPTRSAFIPTIMSGVKVGDAWTTNWTYLISK